MVLAYGALTMVWDQTQKVKWYKQDLYVIWLDLANSYAHCLCVFCNYHHASGAERQTTSIPSISAI